MLASFTFSIEYQEGRYNAIADALSCVASMQDADVVKSILDGVTMGTMGRADTHDPVVAEANERIYKQVEETAVQARAIHMHVNLHVMDWVAVQQEDCILKIVMEWISIHKVQDLEHLLGDHASMEEGMVILREQKKFTLHQGALYHHHTPARELEETMQFVVPTAHKVLAWMGALGKLDIKVNSKHHCKTITGGLKWQCGCRQQSVTVRGVFGTKVPESRPYYKLFWSHVLWSCFMWISLALRWQ